MNPMVRSGRIFALVRTRSATSVATNPSTSDPVALIRNVPQGNEEPGRRLCTQLPTKYRAIAPNAPPIATRPYEAKFILFNILPYFAHAAAEQKAPVTQA
jgi:hypothetical protein